VCMQINLVFAGLLARWRSESEATEPSSVAGGLTAAAANCLPTTAHSGPVCVSPRNTIYPKAFAQSDVIRLQIGLGETQAHLSENQVEWRARMR
jgi:hypothetical protein